jgi:hypothetical protein
MTYPSGRIVDFARDALRGGSVCLNRLEHFYKWILPLVMPQPGLAAAR